MFTKRRGGDICGGDRGGPPVCHLHVEQTKLSLLHLTAKLHEPKKCQYISFKTLFELEKHLYQKANTLKKRYGAVKHPF